MDELLEEVVEKTYPAFNRSTPFGSKYLWTPYKERDAFKKGVKWQQEKSYSEEDMINASKYGYNFHKTTLFPNQEFEDSCINNTKQWLTIFKKK